MLARLSLLTLFVSLASPQLGHAKGRPIVAVFDIEVSGLTLPAEAIGRLTDYIASRLAASGAFQVVPRSTLKQRLKAQRKESYKNCVDQSCQIEIGRELAAQKTLATKIIRLGSACTVTAVTFDLKRSASEGGASAEGPCSEDGLAQSIRTVVDKLSGVKSRADTPLPVPPKVQPKPPPARVEPKVITPPPHPPKTFKPRPPGDPRLRTQYFSIGAAGGYTGNHRYDGPTFGMILRAPTYKWRYLHWTTLELFYGVLQSDDMTLGPNTSDGSNPSEPRIRGILATRLSFPFYFGSRGQHQLRLGLGGGFQGGDGYDDTGVAPMLAPTLEYSYQTHGSLYFECSVFFALDLVQAVVPGDSRQGDNSATQGLYFSLSVGWSASR